MSCFKVFERFIWYHLLIGSSVGIFVWSVLALCGTVLLAYLSAKLLRKQILKGEG